MHKFLLDVADGRIGYLDETWAIKILAKLNFGSMNSPILFSFQKILKSFMVLSINL